MIRFAAHGWLPILGALLPLWPAALAAQSAVTVLEDGDFTGWETTPRRPAWEVAGSRAATGGNPGSHYVVEHVHHRGGFLAPNVASHSLHTAKSFDLSALGTGGLLEVRVDLRGEDAGSLFPPELFWVPLLVQQGWVYSAQGYGESAAYSSVFQRRTLTVPREAFRASQEGAPLTPDFGVGAPPFQLGLLLQTLAIAPVGEPLSMRVHLDNFRARLLPAPTPGVELQLSDRGHQWGDDPLILYRLVVSNGGPPVAGMVVYEVVPQSTVFVAGESTPGWSCYPGPDAGSVCSFELGELETGGNVTLDFGARVLAGTPEAYEVLNQAFVIGPDSRAGDAGPRSAHDCFSFEVAIPGLDPVVYEICSPEAYGTSLTSWGHLGCLCFFGICHD